MARLIDPPVTPYSPIAELRAWEAQLERELPRAALDDRPAVERALEEVQRWIRTGDA